MRSIPHKIQRSIQPNPFISILIPHFTYDTFWNFVVTSSFIIDMYQWFFQRKTDQYTLEILNWSSYLFVFLDLCTVSVDNITLIAVHLISIDSIANQHPKLICEERLGSVLRKAESKFNEKLFQKQGWLLTGGAGEWGGILSKARRQRWERWQSGKPDSLAGWPEGKGGGGWGTEAKRGRRRGKQSCWRTDRLTDTWRLWNPWPDGPRGQAGGMIHFQVVNLLASQSLWILIWLRWTRMESRGPREK